ncbi:MAG: chaperone modulator CbpM [SAR86 cluster bacterium]|jgi:chaperone modulatory protein CbpM|uniref:Chaperone modulatory protein CbpM n=1 Tax=SAR86 cluster bacterium TaxID=2030880 RepID=A0A972VX75_9GAMM|nr:hypothetical protein [SAR86 cluster bacterium]|tara:strand:+ start:179 stop:460 length:282 start_codon:yes stop_codon:yes gene_type:complete
MSVDILTMTEFCQATRLAQEDIHELVNIGIIETLASDQFDSEQVLRCIKARRLQQDLELDLQGVALILELLDQNRHLQRRLQHVEQLVRRLHS